MKIVLLSLLLLLVSICKAQDTITVYSKQWAGGICCSSGNDFTVYFPSQKTSLNIDSVQLFVQGVKIVFSGKLFMTSGPVCSSVFGWRSQNCYSMDCETMSFYGIERRQISTSDGSKNKAIFFYSNGTKKEPFVNYKEEYLAYP